MIGLSDMGLGISLSAFLVCLTNLIFTLISKRTGKTHNKIFIFLLCILMINAVCGMVSTFTNNSKYSSDNAYIVLQVSRYVYFLTHSLIASLFYGYMSSVVGRDLRGNSGGGFANFVRDRKRQIVIIVNELIIALNPVTNWIYVFDDEREFKRAWGEFVFVYAPAVLWMSAALLLFMKSLKVISKSRKYALSFCYFFCLAGVILQLVFSKFRIEVMMDSIGFTGIMFFVENEDDRMDVSTGAYNASAFKLDLRAAKRNGVTAQLIIVRDIANESYSLPIGVYEGYAPERAVAEYLETLAGRYCIYSVGRGTVAALLYKKTEEEARGIAQKMLDRLSEPWVTDGTELRLSGTVLILNIPDRAATIDDVLYICDCPLPENSSDKLMSGSDLDWIVRRSAVEAAVKRGLSEGSFEVYYQPTYTIGRELHGAEALLRMRDKELGSIYPDEFIPIAEQLGIIGDLDEFVFREVCALLKTGVPQSSGIKCIDVNLSVIECMKDGFAEKMIKIADEAGISGSEVVFEITETVAAKDQKRITSVIETLRRRGFTFAIDDFGTGYSNLSATLALGADIIKIDKSVLWGAEKSEQGSILLGASLKMIKEMRKLSIAEGVETEQQIEFLDEQGCDYLQGFYFSRPLPKDDFLRFIAN